MKKSTLMTLTLFVIMGWAVGFVAPQQVAAALWNEEEGSYFNSLIINVTAGETTDTAFAGFTPNKQAFQAKCGQQTSSVWGIYFSKSKDKPADGSTDPICVQAESAESANPSLPSFSGQWKNKTTVDTSTSAFDKGITYYIGLYYEDGGVKKYYASGDTQIAGTITLVRWKAPIPTDEKDRVQEKVTVWEFLSEGTSAELATVTTTDVTGATVGTDGKVSVTSGGVITLKDAVRDKVTAKGVVWDTKTIPADAKLSAYPDTQKKPSTDTTDTFAVTITGLESGGKEYFFRAYATNAKGDALATDEKKFTTPSKPVVADIGTVAPTPGTTSIAFAITGSGSGVTETGVCVGKTANPTETNPATAGVTCGKTTDGKVTISGLTAKTEYYYNAYGKNALGTTYKDASDKTTTLVVGDFNGDKTAGLADLVICVKVASGYTAAQIGGTINKLASVDAAIR